MTTRALVTLLTFICFHIANAESGTNNSANDHLEPEVSVLAGKVNVGYEQKVYKTLIKSSNVRLQLITLPSFKPEEVVYITWNDNSEIKVVCSKVIGSIWGEITKEIVNKSKKHNSYSLGDEAMTRAASKIKIKTTEASSSISQGTAEILIRLWGKALSEVKYASNPTIGLDGVSYHFSSWTRGIGTRAGIAWSPSSGTNIADLVEIGKNLCAFASKPTKDLEEALKIKAEALMKRM